MKETDLKLRHRYRFVLLLLSLFIIFYTANNGISKQKHEYVITHWLDADGKSPDRYQDYLARTGVNPHFKINRQYTSPQKQNGTNFHIIVNQELHPQILPALTQYIADLESEGYEVTLFTATVGTPPALRNHLAGEFAGGMAGCIFIGDLAIAWYNILSSGDQFPIDLYFLDLDGQWHDRNGDGMFDAHTGSTAPEIWLGRLTASPLQYGGFSEAELINRYLERVHQYRLRNLTNSRKALVYIDDDFIGDADEWHREMRLLYHDVDLVTREDQTSGNDYRQRLVNSYEWIQVHVHSSPGGHSFAASSNNNWVRSTELPHIVPNALFYSLYACSNVRYTTTDYMGGWYIFSPGNGLAVLGTTKAGAMLHYQDFYAPLDQNVSLGPAFKQWISIWMETNPFWFYGLTLLGDPTLTVLHDLAFSSYQVNDDSVESSGNSDGKLDAGEQVELVIELVNKNIIDFTDVSASLSTDDPFVTLVDSCESYGHIAAGQTATCLEDFDFFVEPDCPDGHQIPFVLTIIDSDHRTWTDDVTITVNAPDIRYVSHQIEDPNGNNDGTADPGEIFQLKINITNCGGSRFPAGTIHLASADPNVMSIKPENYPFEIQTGDSMMLAPFAVTIRSTTPVPAYIVFTLAGRAPGFSFDDSFTLPIGDGSGFIDDMEQGRNGWIHYAVSPGFADEWHQSSENNHTDDGAVSWKFGDPGTGPYSSCADAALELPPVVLAPASSLGFWHRADIELDWDGAIVELNDGTGWHQLTPVGGYNNSISDGTPLAPGTPCFSGNFTWQQAKFDLSAYTGTVRIRFRFVSDGGLTLDGWYIDDVQIQGQISTIPLAADSHLPQKYALHQNFPNPVNSKTKIKYQLPEDGHVSLLIYNLLGQKITTLVDKYQKAGYYSVQWDFRDLIAGMYVIKLQAGNFSQFRKMILLR